MRASQYEGVLKLNRRTFRRRTGVYPETFLAMLDALRERERKKKRHTMKAQLLVQAMTRQIICTATGRGATHDFTLFKQSRTPIHPETKIKADAGYQGIQKGQALAQTPKKASKHLR